MSRIFTLFGLVLVLAAGISLYQLKHRVEEKEARLLEMQGQMVRDKEAIRVLNAEWALLSSPDKLQAPGQKYLDLRPPEADQVLSSLSELPFRAPSQVDLESSFTALSEAGQPAVKTVPPPRQKPYRRRPMQVVSETPTNVDRLAEAVRRVSGDGNQ